MNIGHLEGPPIDRSAVEVVERKGLGHPDSICDALAEAFSLSLCRLYRERFGIILHHNVDKALLRGGSARPAFGGGEVIEPIEIFLAGRATMAFKGIDVPVAELALETARARFARHFHALDAKRHVRIRPLVRPGSQDLIDLYLRQERTGVALANDTSCGLGFAPLSALETIVLEVERALNSPTTRTHHPEIGQDIKVMAVRRGQSVHLTIACAFVDRFLRNPTDSSVEALGAASPALEAYTTDDLYGDVWQRSDLSARDRSIVTVASLIARNQAADMPAEFSRALENGVTPAELSEIITHLAFYAGWGNAMSAVEVAQGIFAARGVSAEQLPPADPELLPLDEEAEAERERRVQESYGKVSQGVVDNTRELLFRDLWLRPAFKPRDRSLVTASALISAGQVEQMPFHPRTLAGLPRRPSLRIGPARAQGAF